MAKEIELFLDEGREWEPLVEEVVQAVERPPDPFRPRPSEEAKRVEKEKIREILTQALTGEEEKALIAKGFDRVVQEAGRLSESKLLLADLQRAGNRLAERLEPLEEIEVYETMQEMLGLESSTLEGIYQIGRSLYAEGNVFEALAVFTVMTLLNGLLFEPWMMRGICARAEGQSTQALHSFAMASLVRFDDPQPHLQMARCFADLGQRQEAAEELELAEARLGGDRAAYQTELAEITASIR